MAITLVASVTAAPGTTGGTTAAVNTTGADLLVLAVSWYNGGSGGTPGTGVLAGHLLISDSKGNTWTGVTARTTGTADVRLYYATTALVGTGHTFTVAATSGGAVFFYPSLVVRAFAGAHLTAPFEQDTGATANPGTSPLSTAALTPSAAGALLVSALGGGDNSAISVAGMTSTTVAFVPGQTFVGAAGYVIQTSPAAFAAAWSWSGTFAIAVSLAVFLPAPTTATVPDVVGETQAVAVAALTAVGLTAGTITTAVSPTIAAGLVISQSPAGGATVDLASPVDLVIAVTAGLVVTIAGEPRRVLHDSLSIQATVNGRDRLSLTTPPAAAVGPGPDPLLALATGTPGPNGGTFGSIDTTGATLLVFSVAWWVPNVATATVSDSKGNTWLPLTAHAGGNGRHKFYYCLSPTVGTLHTFTVAGGVLFYPSAVVYAFTGIASYQTESGAGHATTGPVASGSVTPSAAGALIVTALEADGAATDSVAPAGFAQITVAHGASVNRQQSAGYVVQSAAAAIDPTWSWTGTHSEIAVSTAVFLPAVLARTTAPAAVRQEIIVEEDGVRIFAGFIDTVVERAATSHTDSDVKKLYDLTAVDYNVLADWRLVNGPRPEETIKAYLTDLVLFLAGVTLDPAQVDGPLLPTRGQTFQTISQVLDEVTTITGYVWNIDYHGRLKMWLPSVEAAPFDILDSNAYAIGDITVEPSTTGYANMVWVLAGDSGQHDISSTFTGDGTTTEWDLPHGLVTHGGTLTHAGVPENVGPGEAWELDALPTPYAFTLRRAIGSAPAVGALIVFPYTAQYPLVFRAQDYDVIAEVGFIVEQVFTEPTVFDPAQGQALVDGYLAQLIQAVREIRYTTRRRDIVPGQTQTITIANRGLSGSFVITDVETRMQDPVLFRHVTARNPGPYAGSWRDVYKLWAQGQTTAVASVPPALVLRR